MRKIRLILSFVIIYAILNGFSFAASCHAKDGVIYNERIVVNSFSGSSFTFGKEFVPYTPILKGDSISYCDHPGYNGAFNINSRMFPDNIKVQKQKRKKPRSSKDKKWECCMAGIAGSVVLMIPASLIKWTVQIEDTGFLGGGSEMNFGPYVGIAIGSAIGVSLVGNSGCWRGSGGLAFLGSTIGSCVSGLVVYRGITSSSPFLIYGGIFMTFTLPSILAAWFFNKSARYKSPPESKNALINFSKDGLRLSVPLVNVQPIRDFGRTGKMFFKMELNFMTIKL